MMVSELKLILLICQWIIAMIGAAIITFSAIKAFYYFILEVANRSSVNISRIRLQFGYSLSLGLEFMVASDIVESMIERDYYILGILAFLVVIRTFLSYFLNKELESLSKTDKGHHN